MDGRDTSGKCTMQKCVSSDGPLASETLDPQKRNNTRNLQGHQENLWQIRVGARARLMHQTWAACKTILAHGMSNDGGKTDTSRGHLQNDLQL